jgi:hypothetical protein
MKTFEEIYQLREDNRITKLFEKILLESKYGKINDVWLEEVFDEFEKQYNYNDWKINKKAGEDYSKSKKAEVKYFNILQKLVKEKAPYKFINVYREQNQYVEGSYRAPLKLGSIPLRKEELKIIIPDNFLSALYEDYKDFKQEHSFMGTDSSKYKTKKSIDRANSANQTLDNAYGAKGEKYPKANWERCKEHVKSNYHHEITHYFQVSSKDSVKKFRDLFMNDSEYYKALNQTEKNSGDKAAWKDIKDMFKSLTKYETRTNELEAWSVTFCRELLKYFDPPDIIEMTENESGREKLLKIMSNVYHKRYALSHDYGGFVDTLKNVKEERSKIYNFFFDHIKDYIEDNFEL